MFNKIKNRAKLLIENVDISEKLNSTKQFLADSSNSTKKIVINNFESGKDIANDYFDKNWNFMERILVEGLLSLAEEALKDEKNIKMFFEKFYELLPTGVRLVLSREKFVELSMKKRDPLLLSLQQYKIQKKSDAISLLDKKVDVL